MDIKKLQNELQMTNDVLVLSKEELIEKYGKNESSVEKFLLDFSHLFVVGTNYSIMMGETYNKITSFIQKYTKEYPENKDIQLYAHDILETIQIEENRDKRISEYMAEVLFLFKEGLGSSRLKKKNSISDLSTMFLKYPSMIEPALAEPTDLDFYNDLLDNAKNMARVRNDESHISLAIASICNCFDKTKLCFDPEFLVFANYLINGNHRTVPVDEKFIALVKEIIDISQNFRGNKYIPNFDEKEYRKIANITQRNIKKYEKRHSEQKEKQEKGLRKIFGKKK